jgi:hypothetical protein
MVTARSRFLQSSGQLESEGVAQAHGPVGCPLSALSFYAPVVAMNCAEDDAGTLLHALEYIYI